LPAYRVTVETSAAADRSLHRALLAAGVRDMALISYNNGAAIVSWRRQEPDPDTRRQPSAGDVRAPGLKYSDHAFVVKLAEDCDVRWLPKRHEKNERPAPFIAIESLDASRRGS
jgi:hypothetical protein